METEKICTICKVSKSIESFRKHKKGKHGVYAQCLDCENKQAKEDYDKNKELKRQINKIWRENNKEKIRKQSRDIYWKDIEKSRKEGRRKNQAFRDAGKYNQWVECNKEKINKWHSDKRKSDPLYKLSCNLRARTRSAFKKGNFTKKSSLSQYLGCSIEELKTHMESLFQPGMSWENYGNKIGQWSIDHKIPLSSAQSEEELYKLCHYTNLQPMWAVDNIKKGNKLIYDISLI